MEPTTEEGTTPPMDPVSVLAGVMARQGSELSATETLERELSRADNLGVLGGIWDDLARREQRARFEQVLRGVLPADLAEQALGDRACTWLWRSLREAETAGLNGGDVLPQAVVERSLASARDVARVLDSRVRRMLDGLQPQPPGPWTDRVPATGSAEVDRYRREVAKAIDDGFGGSASMPRRRSRCGHGRRLGRCRTIRSSGQIGNSGPALWLPTEKRTDSYTPATRSGPSLARPAQRPARLGMAH